MLSYEFYKVLHVFMIIIYFASAATLFNSGNCTKASKIALGVSSFLILVGGFGLMARLGIGHGQMWPGWLIIKFVAWLLLAALGPILNKRLSPAKKQKAFKILLIIGFLAVYSAVFKPFS